MKTRTSRCSSYQCSEIAILAGKCGDHATGKHGELDEGIFKALNLAALDIDQLSEDLGNTETDLERTQAALVEAQDEVEALKVKLTEALETIDTLNDNARERGERD